MRDPSAADFHNFKTYGKVTRRFSQVLILEDTTYPQCKFVVKELRCLKKDVSPLAGDDRTDANARKKPNSENDNEVSYSPKEYVNDGIQVMSSLPKSSHFPKYYAHFEEEHEEFIQCFIIMEYVEGENLEYLIESVSLFV